MAKSGSVVVSFDHRTPMIEELFRDHLPLNNTMLRGKVQVGNLGDEMLQYIMFRTWQRWKTSQISDVLGISSKSVRSVLYRFKHDAINFWDCKIVTPITPSDRRRPARYLCRFHGEQFASKGVASSHCWETVFDPDAL